jgi:NhaA family Na+:H+ antiporter
MMNPASIPLRPSRLDPLVRPLNAFLSAESVGGIMLMVSALAALVWANSPWRGSYQHVWHAVLSVVVAGYSHAMSLEHWVNDGLMVVFFLLVGLEIKRELIIGELASLRRATLPIAAAIGGMVIPALIYVAFNVGGPGAAGWGVPMATDIAFAVGVLALVGRAVPTSVKVFLLAVAIVDAGLIALNFLGVHRPLPYILLGVGLWAATLYSGIHATIAGVLLALTIPATRQIEERPYVDYARKMLEWFERDATAVPDRITADQSHAIKAMEEASQAVQTPLALVEHALLIPVNFLIIPLFALANAGVDLRSGGTAVFSSSIMWGVLLGLLVGKPVGVLLASWAAVKAGMASLPEEGTVRQIVGVAFLCGIGFTMSLFVANLAFPGQADHLAASKVGILTASVVSGVVGGMIIASVRRVR